MRALIRLIPVLAALAVAISAFSCGKFDPPPDVIIVNEENGQMLTTPSDPLVLQFSEKIDVSTLKLKIVKDERDGEGFLLDEQDPPKPFGDSLILAYDGSRPNDENATYGAVFEFSETPDGDTLLTIDNESFNPEPFKLAAYMLVVEPGLQDQEGIETKSRLKVRFSFVLSEGGKTRLPSGYYFFLLDIDYLSQQLQLHTYMEVDPDTGSWTGIFTDADRTAALNNRAGCPDCGSDKVCGLFPAPACYTPSDKQKSLSEWPDWVPVPDEPDGYAFTVDGYAKDQDDGSIAMATVPFNINISIGAAGVRVETQGTVVAGEFLETEPGRYVGAGSASVVEVVLNGSAQGPTQGTFTAMSLFADEVALIESYGTPIPTDFDLGR